MLTILNTQTFTYFPTREAAAKIAAANQAADDTAEYRVEEAKAGFFVAVYEDGERIITL